MTRAVTVDEQTFDSTWSGFPPNYCDVYTVLAGLHRSSIVVHKDILCAGSDYFTLACERAWQFGGGHRPVVVAEVEPETMRMYVRWKYTRKIDYSIWPLPDNGKAGKGMVRYWISDMMRALLCLYVACDLFLDDEAKNATRKEIMALSNQWKKGCIFSRIEFLEYVWKHTKPDASLRNYVLDSCAAKGKLGDFGNDYEEPPHGFFRELVERYTVVRHERASVTGEVEDQGAHFAQDRKRADVVAQQTLDSERQRDSLSRASTKRPRSVSSSENGEDEEHEHVRADQPGQKFGRLVRGRPFPRSAVASGPRRPRQL
ncbi:hypothetical protein LTR17_021221 [Elasticomyces elasticus]|nr:hypothetical protein LTR17_021221 [Elasticomyces elasticus]